MVPKLSSASGGKPAGWGGSRPPALILALLLAMALLVPQLGPGTARAQTAATAKIDPSLLAQMAADRAKLLPVIVEMGRARAPFPSRPNAQLAQQALDLLRLYGRPVGALPLIDGAGGFANAAGIEAMSLDPAVGFVHEDSAVQPAPGRPDSRTNGPPGQLSASYPRTVRADRVWLQGTAGKGVTVAVLDSGVAPDADLTQPTNRLLAAVNFAGDRGELADPGGHGTHVAGIIAGNGTRSGGEYVGIAPQANVVDVRVLNRNGSGRVSSFVRAIEWVLAHRDQYNIRVINLSIGAPARRSYRLDPMAAAVELAWKRGLVVVAASGNAGPDRDTVVTPGIDPYAITVGAIDDQGSSATTDDQLAWFSAWGTPPDSTPKPDLVAPGRRIVSVRAVGSYLDTQYSDRAVVAKNGSTYFRLTGTSMATAVVSGVAALLLERQPGLSPDQVKAILMGATQSYGQASSTTLPDPSADGNGLVDAEAAIKSPSGPAANRGLRPTDGLARTFYPALYGRPLVWKDPQYQGINWAGLTWETLVWDSLAWDNFAWDAVDWTNFAWDNFAWDNFAWDNFAWDNFAWDGLAFD